MPKIKTRRGTAKRFAKTGGGKIKRARGFRRHILTKMSRKRKRQLRNTAYISPADEPAVNQMLPY